MNEEYVWKETTGKLAVLDTKPNHNITFHNGDKQMGALDFNGPEMTFTGDMDESAKLFFDFIAKSFKARLEQERAAREFVGLTDEEIESIFNNLPTYHLDHEEFARAIKDKLRNKLRSKNEDRN